METGIKDFLVKYKEKLENDNDIKENELSVLKDNRERIVFSLTMRSSCPSLTDIWTHSDAPGLFILDEEDLEYLYKKYCEKVEDELKQNTLGLHESYKDVLTTNGI